MRSQDDHCQNKEEWANRTSSITNIPGYKDAILCGLCNVNVSILVFFGGGLQIHLLLLLLLLLERRDRRLDRFEGSDTEDAAEEWTAEDDLVDTRDGDSNEDGVTVEGRDEPEDTTTGTRDAFDAKEEGKDASLESESVRGNS